MRRRGTRSVRSRSRQSPTAARYGPSGVASRSTTPETGANFLTAGALEAARPERPPSSLTRASITSDCGPTSSGRRRCASTCSATWRADLGLADRAVHTWWPDAPGTVRDVRFAHSPGRFDPAYLNSLGAFDAAFVLDLGDGTQGIVGVDTKYHERAKPETPKPSKLRRYLEVAEKSGAFAAGAIDAVKGRRDLAVMWLEHLLLLSMLQHASGTWAWGRYVVVHPAGNTDFADACSRYETSSSTSRRSPR